MINVQSLIDGAVEENNRVKGEKRDATKFHVSDAGTCYRKRFLKRSGAVPTTTIPTKNLRKMVAGDAGHEKLQSLLETYGKLKEAEGTVESEHILGHYDAIIQHDGALALLEFKTVEKWSMGHIRRQGAKPEHKIQLCTYWDFLRKDHKHLDHAVLSYVKREDFESHDFYYIWSDIIAQQVKEEWEPLIGYWERQELPPCTCHEDYGGNGVAYCSYQDGEGGCCSTELFTKKE